MKNFSDRTLKAIQDALTAVVDFFKKKIKAIVDFVKNPWNWVVIGVILLVTLIVCLIISTHNKQYLNTCIEDGIKDFTNSSSNSLVYTYPYEESFLETPETKYTHGKAEGKMRLIRKLADGTTIKKDNSQLLNIEISGSWIPWFGDLVEKDRDGKITDTFQRDVATPSKDVVCRYKKDYYDNKEKNRKDREYYYLDNYYSSYTFDAVGSESGELTLKEKSTELNPLMQEACWIEGGTGLYIGFSSIDGNSYPKQFHHLKANQLVCNPYSFLPPQNQYLTYGKAKFNAITTFDMTYDKLDGTDLNYGDYIFENFSLDYAEARKNAYDSCKKESGTNISNCIKNKITEGRKNFNGGKQYFLTYEDGYIVYNITDHEDALINADIPDYQFLINKATRAFQDACFSLNKEKLTVNKSSTEVYKKTYEAKYRFKENDNNRVLRDYDNKTEYKNGEVAKLIVLDKYYSDNQGEYTLVFKGGLTTYQVDDGSKISSSFRKIETFLFGTSMPNQADDRQDGFVYQVYKKILDSGFEVLAKTALALYIALKGLNVILGFERVKRGDFMLFCLKLAFLFSIVDSDGWAFYNKTFINFFYNGVIGILELLANMFASLYGALANTPTLYKLTNLQNLFTSNIMINSKLEISKYLVVFDDIFEFLKDANLHKRILSLFYIKGNPAFGLLLVIASYHILFLFVKGIIISVMPLLINLIQLAILLPLAPIFLVFMFFSKTKQFFKNWLQTMVSRSFEVLIFFFVLFLSTSLVFGRIESFYSYKICYRQLYSASQSDDGLKNEDNLVSLNKVKGNWIVTAVQKVTKFVFVTLFGWMIVIYPEGLNDTPLFSVILNVLFIYLILFMYRQINENVTKVFVKLFSFKDPKDKNDKGEFVNSGSGLVGDKGNASMGSIFSNLFETGHKSKDGFKGSNNKEEEYMDGAYGLNTLVRRVSSIGSDKARMSFDKPFISNALAPAKAVRDATGAMFKAAKTLDKKVKEPEKDDKKPTWKDKLDNKIKTAIDKIGQTNERSSTPFSFGKNGRGTIRHMFEKQPSQERDAAIAKKYDSLAKQKESFTGAFNRINKQHQELSDKMKNTKSRLKKFFISKRLESLERQRTAIKSRLAGINGTMAEIQSRGLADHRNGGVNPLTDLVKNNAKHLDWDKDQNVIRELIERNYARQLNRENGEDEEQHFNIQPGTEPEAFMIQVGENAFIVATPDGAFYMLENDKLYPQDERTGEFDIPPEKMEELERDKKGNETLAKVNHFSNLMLQVKQNQIQQQINENGENDKLNEQLKEIQEQMEKLEVKKKRIDNKIKEITDKEEGK